MNNSIAQFIENWQMLLAIVAILGVGYGTIRRFEMILGKNEEGRTIVDRLGRLEGQLFPNGGSSIPDKVEFLSNAHAELSQDVKELAAKTEIMHGVLLAFINSSK